MKFKKHTQTKLLALSNAGSIMFIGLFLFKYIPMQIFGEHIKFDASAHITITIFFLYIIWFFIDQNKSWRTVFFIFSFLVLAIVSIQRILVDAHNDFGLLAGLILSVCAIVFSQKRFFKNKFKF